jgi:MerR family transcriptional regulator, copper efflux regulator
MDGIDLSSYFRSSELARLTGVSTDTLRHYERKGLLSARRSANGYREYARQSIDHVRLVQNALSVGFTLDELSRILKVRQQGGVPCQDVRALAVSKLKALEEQIAVLSGLRNDLQVILRTWDTKLAQTRAGERAHLLDMFSIPPTPVNGPAKDPATAAMDRNIRKARTIPRPSHWGWTQQ